MLPFPFAFCFCRFLQPGKRQRVFFFLWPYPSDKSVKQLYHPEENEFKILIMTVNQSIE